MNLKTAMSCVVWLWISPIWSQPMLDIRLDVAEADPVRKILFVDLSIRYDGLGQVVLGDQNYRLFFNSQNLAIRRSKEEMLLPKDQYSDLHFHESFKNIEAASTGNLSYDHDLGFLNIGTDLLSDQRGGLKLSAKDGWVAVVRLQFDVDDVSRPCKIDWSQPSKTGQYASAFVEMTQWESPDKARSFVLDEVFDLDYTIRPEQVEKPFAIGPNPATDRVRIHTGTYVDELLYVHVTDPGGKTVWKTKKKRGSGLLSVPVEGWPSASYKLEIYDDQYQKVFHESIVVMR